jgi:hypothetical protein
MAALMAMVPIAQLLFGSDYPYFTLEENVVGLMQLQLSAAEQQAINRGNAARIMPRYESGSSVSPVSVLLRPRQRCRPSPDKSGGADPGSAGLRWILRWRIAP